MAACFEFITHIFFLHLPILTWRWVAFISDDEHLLNKFFSVWNWQLPHFVWVQCRTTICKWQKVNWKVFHSRNFQHCEPALLLFVQKPLTLITSLKLRSSLKFINGKLSLFHLKRWKNSAYAEHAFLHIEVEQNMCHLVNRPICEISLFLFLSDYRY